MTAVSPLRALAMELKPDLLDNPLALEFLAAYESQLTAEEVAALGAMVPPLVDAFNAGDYPAFKGELEKFGYGAQAPYIFALLQQGNE